MSKFGILTFNQVEDAAPARFKRAILFNIPRAPTSPSRRAKCYAPSSSSSSASPASTAMSFHTNTNPNNINSSNTSSSTSMAQQQRHQQQLRSVLRLLSRNVATPKQQPTSGGRTRSPSYSGSATESVAATMTDTSFGGGNNANVIMRVSTMSPDGSLLCTIVFLAGWTYRGVGGHGSASASESGLQWPTLSQYSLPSSP